MLRCSQLTLQVHERIGRLGDAIVIGAQLRHTHPIHPRRDRLDGADNQLQRRDNPFVLARDFGNRRKLIPTHQKRALVLELRALMAGASQLLVQLLNCNLRRLGRRGQQITTEISASRMSRAACQRTSDSDATTTLNCCFRGSAPSLKLARPRRTLSESLERSTSRPESVRVVSAGSSRARSAWSSASFCQKDGLVPWRATRGR